MNCVNVQSCKMRPLHPRLRVPWTDLPSDFAGNTGERGRVVADVPRPGNLGSGYVDRQYPSAQAKDQRLENAIAGRVLYAPAIIL